MTTRQKPYARTRQRPYARTTSPHLEYHDPQPPEGDLFAVDLFHPLEEARPVRRHGKVGTKSCMLCLFRSFGLTRGRARGEIRGWVHIRTTTAL
jgi:hypothetical protein